MVTGQPCLEHRETNIAEWNDFICTNIDEKCSSGVSDCSSVLTVYGDGVLYIGS